MTDRRLFALAFVASSLAFGCSGSTPAATTPADPAQKKEAPAAWSKGLPKADQMALMKTLTGRLAPLFHKADSKDEQKFGCKSCHGPELKDPHEVLPKLTLKDGKITAFEEKPEVAKFMAEKVVPESAAALGLTPYDPKTKQGFGCMGCHAVNKD